MSGFLTHPPYQILAKLLVDLSLGTGEGYSGSEAWPVFASYLPDKPDNCIVVYETTGIDQGRNQMAKVRDEKPGYQIRVRSNGPTLARTKIDAIVSAIDLLVLRNSVVIGGTTYLVHLMTRTSPVLPLGPEPSNTFRRSFTINGTTKITQE